MTDYEAVFEDLMRYTRGSPDEASKRGLLRFFRDNDRRGTLSDDLLEQLVDTRSAKQYLEEQKSIEDFRSKGSANVAAQRREEKRLMSVGKRPVKERGKTKTITTKKGERKVLFVSSENKEIYADKVVIKGTERVVYRTANGGFARK
jgi:hypothetical protein